MKLVNSKIKTARARGPRNWRDIFRRPRPAHDPRDARSEGSQFRRTGWIVQPVQVPVSLQRLASMERAAAARRSGDPLLALNMSIFNFEGGWSRIFNQITPRENN